LHYVRRLLDAEWRLRRVERARRAKTWLRENPQTYEPTALGLSLAVDPFSTPVPEPPDKAARRAECARAVSAVADEFAGYEDRLHGMFDRSVKLLLELSQAGDSWVKREFVLSTDAAAVVDEAIRQIAEEIGGKNAPGRALEFLAADFAAGDGMRQVDDSNQ
jgi:hypothetical protein